MILLVLLSSDTRDAAAQVLDTSYRKSDRLWTLYLTLRHVFRCKASHTAPQKYIKLKKGTVMLQIWVSWAFVRVLSLPLSSYLLFLVPLALASCYICSHDACLAPPSLWFGSKFMVWLLHYITMVQNF